MRRGTRTTADGGKSGLAAIVPLQRLEWQELARTYADIDELGQRDAVVPFLRELDHVALEPTRRARDEGQPGGRVLGLDLGEGPIDDALGDPVHSVREKGHGELLGIAHVNEGAAALRERERDEHRLERRLHEPGAEHEMIASLRRSSHVDRKSTRLNSSHGSISY